MADLANLSADEVGSLVGVSGRRIRQMAQEQKIPQPVDGKWSGPAVVGALLTAAKADRVDPEAVGRGKLLAARAEAVEIANKEKRRDLISMTEAQDTVDAIVGAVRAEFGGLAARFTRDLKTRNALHGEITATLNRISDKLQAIASGDDD